MYVGNSSVLGWINVCTTRETMGLEETAHDGVLEPMCAVNLLQQRREIKESLTKALEELRAGAHEGELPDPAMVAEQVEAAMYKHFGKTCFSGISASPKDLWDLSMLFPCGSPGSHSQCALRCLSSCEPMRVVAVLQAG